MRIARSSPGALAAAVLLACLSAGVASAQSSLHLDQVGAALVLPLIGDAPNGVETYITITNVASGARNLHLNVIDDEWRVSDFDCPLTAHETVLIRWYPYSSTRYRLEVDCNEAGANPRRGRRSLSFRSRSGVLFVTNESDDCGNATCTLNSNDLMGDAVIVNPTAGWAASAGAIPFQGKDPLAAGVADREYHFDNIEYAMFPRTLASGYIEPGANVSGQLILFTLDGRPNSGPRASIAIVGYDDDETPTSGHYQFDCFAVVDLDDLIGSFASQAGHFYLSVEDIDQPGTAHDEKYGDGNGLRVVGVHGWILQRFEGETPGYWMRPLAQGPMPQPLLGGDVPTFDGL